MGACRKLDGPGICSQSFQFRFQRLVHAAQCLDVGLHYGKLLCCNMNSGPRSHVHRHTDSASREKNHSKNDPGWNYSAPAPHLCARSEDIDRNLLHRSQ